MTNPMGNQENWMNGMLTMARFSFETGMRTMGTFQQQAEKAIEMTMNNTSAVQDETKRAIHSWMESVNQSSRVYAQTVEEGLNALEKQLNLNRSAATPPTPPKTK